MSKELDDIFNSPLGSLYFIFYIFGPFIIFFLIILCSTQRLFSAPPFLVEFNQLLRENGYRSSSSRKTKLKTKKI